MLPTKLKRKLTQGKDPSNDKAISEKEASVDVESDYESDEVILLL